MADSHAEAVAFRAIEIAVKQRLGLYYAPDQNDQLRKKLVGTAEKLGLDSPKALLSMLRTDADYTLGVLAEELTTNHTSFFREPSVLGRISTDILPSLSPDGEHRIWCAASSTGQEPYSVAVLLADALSGAGARQRFSILATDLVRSVVATAEAGRYSAEAMRSVSPEQRARWFIERGGGSCEVGPDLRRMVTFRCMNLIAERWPFSRLFSLILCRNVLYYFDHATQRSLLMRMFDACEKGGWLLTSVSESLQQLNTPWKTLGPGVHRKIG